MRIKFRNITLSEITKFIILCYIIEIILGGGGTILKYNGISFRMILFSLIIVLYLLLFFKYRQPNILIGYLIYFLLATCFHSLCGIIEGANIEYVKIDVQKSLGFLMIIPFSILEMDDKFDRIIFKSTVILGLIFLIMLLALWTLDFNYIYLLYSNIGQQEIFFRNEKGFLYKGLLFLNIGLIFSFYKKGINKFTYVCFFIILIYFTYTRGFYLSLATVFVVYILFFTSVKNKIKAYIMSILFVPFIFRLFSFIKNGFGDKTGSDYQRILQVKEVIEMTNIRSSLWGHGYGIGTATRPISMEIAFLEIFHKQGILGLLFYFILLAIPFYIYIFKLKYSKKNYEPYILSSIFIFFQSFTNPYINNPIGMTFVVLTVIKGFYLLKSEEQDE